MTYKGYFSPYHNYVRLLSTHELIHVAHLSTTSQIPYVLSRVFGPLFYPHNYIPNWFTEGIAVVAESHDSRYEGRLNDARQWGYFKHTAQQGKLKSLAEVTSHFNSQFPYGRTRYLYGSQFLDYIRLQYGQEKLTQLIESHGGDWLSYTVLFFPSLSLDRLSKSIYGKSLQALYKEWKIHEIEASKDWSITGEAISTDRSVKQFPLLDDGQLYVYHTRVDHPSPHYYKRVYGVSKYDVKLKSWQFVKQLYQPMDYAFEIEDNSFYGAFSNVQSGFVNSTLAGYGGIKVLTQIALDTKQETILFKDKIDAFTVQNKTVFFAQNGQWLSQSTIYKWENGGKEMVLTVPISISELRSIPGQLVGLGQNKRFQWVVFSIDLNSLQMTELYTSPWSLSHITVDDHAVTFTINKGKSLETHQVIFDSNQYRRISSGPYVDAGVVRGDDLFFTGITHDGNTLYTQKQRDQLLDRPVYSPVGSDDVSSDDGGVINYHSSAVLQSSKHVFPYFRVPLFFMGEDDLRLIRYGVGYDSSIGMFGQVLFNYFLPYQGFYLFDETNRLLGVQRLVYRSLSPGIQSVVGGVGYDFYDDDMGLFTTVDYGFLNDKGSVDFTYAPSGSSYYGIMTNQYTFRNTSISLKGTMVDGYSWFDRLRGYKTVSIGRPNEFNTSIDLMHRVFSVSRSLWNPIMGVGDIFVGVFSDYSSYRDQMASGYYVTVEFLVSSLNIPLTVSVGQSFSSGNGSPVFLQFGFSFGSGLAGRKKRL